jgi:chemotaxis protein methyltransferase CheR
MTTPAGPAPAGTIVTSPALSDAEFRRVRALMHRLSGVDLRPGKEALVRSRLSRRLRATGAPSYAAYLDLVEGAHGAAERGALVDALTTNKTSFFRERSHFDYLRDVLLPALRARRGERRVRIWCAGCSSGDEAYSIALVLRESFPDLIGREPPILATDISGRMVAQAREARYDHHALAQVSPALLAKYFTELRPTRDGEGTTWQLAPSVRELVRVEPLNLAADAREWVASGAEGPYDAIFCRNVMIYFDRATQQRLVERFTTMLAPGGWFFIGHAESMAGVRHGLTYVQPAVFRR